MTKDPLDRLRHILESIGKINSDVAEHASAEEYRAVLARARGRLYLLGLLLAFVYYIPLVNLAAPVLSALAFTHFCLAELAAIRRMKDEGGRRKAPHSWDPEQRRMPSE